MLLTITNTQEIKLWANYDETESLLFCLVLVMQVHNICLRYLHPACFFHVVHCNNTKLNVSHSLKRADLHWVTSSMITLKV